MESLPEGQKLSVVIITFILAAITFFIALRAGFFRLPSSFFNFRVSFSQLVGVFVIYLVLAFAILPMLLILIAMPFSSHPGEIPESWKKWAQLSSLFGLFWCMVGYCFLIKRETAVGIFWGDKKPSKERFFKSFFMGVLTWIISYPFVLFVTSLLAVISTMIWGKSEIEQVAVLQLKKTMDDPLLFSSMIVAVAFLVPFMEELLFRGFLQSYLRQYLGRMGGIFLTAFIFACIHYAGSQGVGNFQLIPSLFILSLFLGFIYEKERTLWAPIGLHVAFNLTNALLIFFQK